jgi:hypothetical protein
VASWRSDVDPRGVVVVFFAEEPGAAGLAKSHPRRGASIMHSSSLLTARSPPASRVAAALTNDKSLGQRAADGTGATRDGPASPCSWLDGRGGRGPRGAARSPAVSASRLRSCSHERVRRAGTCSRAHRGGELHVLEIVSPIDDAAWTEVVRFLDEIERRQASMPLRSLMAPPRPISMQSRTKWRASASFPGERAPAGGRRAAGPGRGSARRGVSEQLRGRRWCGCPRGA